LFSSCRILLSKLSVPVSGLDRSAVKSGTGGDSVILRFTKGGSYMAEIFRPTHGFSDVQPIGLLTGSYRLFFYHPFAVVNFGGIEMKSFFTRH